MTETHTDEQGRTFTRRGPSDVWQLVPARVPQSMADALLTVFGPERLAAVDAGCQNRADLPTMAMVAADVRPGMRMIRHRNGEALPSELVHARTDRPAARLITFGCGLAADSVVFSVHPDDGLQIVGERVAANELAPGDVVRLGHGWATLGPDRTWITPAGMTWREAYRHSHAELEYVRAYVDPAWELAQAQQESGWSGYPGTRR